MEWEIPKPGPEHDALSRLCGRFEGEETMQPSSWCPEEQKRTCSIEARMLDGFFAVTDYVQRNGEEVTFRGHGVYSWDSGASCYKMYWFDSMGGPGGVADGQMEGDVLTFHNESPMGKNRYRYTFSDRETKFEMAISQDGESWQDMMVGIYRRL